MTNIPKFTIKQLLEAGVHFGHKTMRRNPKTAKYVFDERGGVSIINLEKTAQTLFQSLKVVKNIAKNNGRILFVATKKQACDIVKESATRCGQYYVNHRWLGGMLTNWNTVSKSIRTLRKIEEQLADDQLNLVKKEKLTLLRRKEKLEKSLGGIKDMGGYPDLVFVIDTNRESLAVFEAKRLNIPVMAIIDTNCNPDQITYPIPGNDDSIKAIKLYCNLLSDAILSGIQESMSDAGVKIKAEEFDASKAISAVKEAKQEAFKPAKKPAAKKPIAKKPAAKTPAKEDAKAPAAAEPKKPAKASKEAKAENSEEKVA